MTVPATAHRTRDWTPLADTDPVPGDPAAIRAEAAHMRRLAQGLRDQARELRAIAHTEGLRGKYATALRDNAADLESHLRQTAERYEHVRSHLTGWATELEDLQAESLAVLRRAHACAHDADAHDAHPLRAALARLTTARDDRAALYAGRIRRACDDVIKDSVWQAVAEDVRVGLDQDWLGRFFELAGWVTTVVGVTALFLTPPGWLLDLALATTFALTAKDLLALGVGDGSWYDIGMDAVGLSTMGTGEAAAGALGRIRSATKTAAAVAAHERAASDVLRDARPELDRAYRVTARRASTNAEKSAARRARAALLATADRAGSAARLSEHAHPLPPTTPRQALPFGGDHDTASLAADINRMRTQYADNEAVLHASRRAPGWEATAKASFWVGTGIDGIDKGLGRSNLLGFKPSSDDYEHFKGRFTSTVGTGW
jgi:hypothetical protein